MLSLLAGGSSGFSLSVTTFFMSSKYFDKSLKLLVFWSKLFHSRAQVLENCTASKTIRRSKSRDLKSNEDKEIKYAFLSAEMSLMSFTPRTSFKIVKRYFVRRLTNFCKLSLVPNTCGGWSKSKKQGQRIYGTYHVILSINS